MKNSRCSHCEGPAALARRDFLRVGGLSFLGITLADFLRSSSTLALAETTSAAPPAKAQSIILFWLEGGASQVDTWDVKGNSSFRNISTNVPGIQICEVFPKLARHMDKLSIIRSMKTDE